MSRFTNGWVKVYRSAGEGDLIGNPMLFALWFRLLIMATWKPTKILSGGKQVELPPGSVVFGLGEFAKSWKCSKGVIHKWLRYLHDTGRIVHTASTRGTIITICKWETYQSIESDELIEREHGVNTASTRREHGVNLIEEGKKERKKETNTRRSRSESDQAFEDAYGDYPRKEGKSGGKKIFEKLSPEEQALVPVAIQNYRTRKAGTDAQYLLHFKTFMGQWRDWLDAQTGTAVAPSARDEAEDLLRAYEAEKAAFEAQANGEAS